jgi:hypothetical protein
MATAAPLAVISERQQVRRVFAVGTVGVLVAGLATQLLLHREPAPAAVPLAPTEVFSILAEPQQPQDVVAADHLKYSVDPATTRLLGDGYYLAVGLTGDACLVSNGGVDVGCTAFPADHRTTVMQVETPRRLLALVPDGFAAGSAWSPVGRNLLVHD